MKRIALGALATIFAAGSANAAMLDNTPWYVSLGGDLTWITDTDIESGAAGTVEFEIGGGANLAAGYKIANIDGTLTGIRTELELGYHSAEVDNANGSLKFGTIMANLYYDIPTSLGFTPFIGAGVGAARLYLSRDAGIGNTDDDANSFAYQGVAGVSYTPEAMPTTDLFISYRYLGIYQPEFGNIELESVHTNSVEVGLRYHF